MNRNFIFKVAVALCFVAVAVLWLLSELKVITVDLTWTIALLAFALAAIFILRGLFSKTVGSAKKLWIVLGGALVVAGVIALMGSVISENIVFPIIAIVITVVVLLCIFATGGKKWDEGDNTKVGYKDYWARKREQEEKEKNDKENKD